MGRGRTSCGGGLDDSDLGNLTPSIVLDSEDQLLLILGMPCLVLAWNQIVSQQCTDLADWLRPVAASEAAPFGGSQASPPSIELA